MQKNTVSLKIFFLIVAALFFFHACCTKKDCVDPLYQIELYNYDSKDVDTIIFAKYLSGSNFITKIDSQNFTGYQPRMDSTYFITIGTLDPQYDYALKIPATGQIYNFTDFKISKYPCNSCFPYTPQNEYHTSISEFKVNGKTTNGEIKIYK